MSTLDLMFEPRGSAVHRVEVFSGTGRRRRFSETEKGRVVEETLSPGAVVSEIARRHGLSPRQVFTWRRAARERLAAHEENAPPFVPAVVEAKPAPAKIASSSPRPVSPRPVSPRPVGKRRHRAPSKASAIALELDGIVARVRRGADARTLAAVIGALKAGA